MNRPVLVLIAIALGGCAGSSLHRYPHTTTHILHPIIEGQVYQNQVVIDSSGDEAPYGVAPGTLSDDAVLTALDATQLCVQVNVRMISEERGAQSPLGAWRVYLRAHQTVREDSRVEGATQSMAVVPGTRPRQVQTGYENYCGGYDRYGNCYSWQQRPTYTTVYDPAQYTVITQSGQACFVNGGFVAEDTDEIEVYFVVPDRSNGVGFEWQFDVAEGS